MTKAVKHNQTKVDLSYLPETAVLEECKAWMFGSEKYGRDNWKKLWGKDTINVAMASLLRHSMAITSGELFDEESGLPHAAHIRCNAAMVLEHMANINLITPKVYETKSDKKVTVRVSSLERSIGGDYVTMSHLETIKESDVEEYRKRYDNVVVFDYLSPEGSGV